MSSAPWTTRELRETLLSFHSNRGFVIYPSFPILSGDPTVMFTNATITPFKDVYLDPTVVPRNYALVQNCFRVGGTVELEQAGIDPYSHTFFEMFGSGFFSATHAEASAYLLDVLSNLGLALERFHFTIPPCKQFYDGLVDNGVATERITVIIENNKFWQAWRFGKNGPVGQGLTAIYCRDQGCKPTLQKMVSQPDHFVELLNLIHIYGQEEPFGVVKPIAHPGFELGMGMERLAAVVQGCHCYATDALAPLVEQVSIFARRADIGLSAEHERVLTDHLRAVIFLVSEGIPVSNKKEGHVIRRLIRRTLEITWISAGRFVAITEILPGFHACLRDSGYPVCSADLVVEVISNESASLAKAIRKAQKVLQKNPDLRPDVLKDTYGVSPALLSLTVKEESPYEPCESS